jgi:hypothetical protein
VSDTETVVVDAGTFDNCLLFRLELDATAEYVDYLWFAENVGIVKVERDPVGVYPADCAIVNGGDNPFQLTSYYLGACGASCTGSAVASSLGATPAHPPSDMGKHLLCLLLPVTAVLAIHIWRKRR